MSSAVAAARLIAAPTFSSSVPTVGTKRTIAASNAGSASTGGSACSKLSALAPPSRSIGFAALPSCGMTSASAARVASPGCGSSSPAASHASAARIPSPPAFVTSATRRPRGTGCAESSVATSISSSSVRARITPAWRKSASTATSEPASAAVCEPAARLPARVLPPFSARIGLRRASRRAMRENARGLPNDSR